MLVNRTFFLRLIGSGIILALLSLALVVRPHVHHGDSSCFREVQCEHGHVHVIKEEKSLREDEGWPFIKSLFRAEADCHLCIIFRSEQPQEKNSLDSSIEISIAGLSNQSRWPEGSTALSHRELNYEARAGPWMT